MWDVVHNRCRIAGRDTLVASSTVLMRLGTYPKAQRRPRVTTRIRDGPPIVFIYMFHDLSLERRKTETHGSCDSR